MLEAVRGARMGLNLLAAFYYFEQESKTTNIDVSEL